MARRKKPKQITDGRPGSVRRGRGDGTRLDPALEELARGDSGRIRRPRPPRRPRLRDPRAFLLVPGVSNRDARRVFDARLAALQQSPNEEARGLLLAEAWALRLWRCRRLTGFEALAADLLELEPVKAKRDATEASTRHDLPLDLTDEAIAVWMRAEAALLEQEVTGVRVCVRGHRTTKLIIELPADQAAVPLHAIGRRQTELARDAVGEPGPGSNRPEPRDR